MQKVYSLIFLLLFAFKISYSQFNKANQNSLGLSIGIQNLKFNDQLASPLIYKAKSFPLVGLNYTRQNANTYMRYKISVGQGKASPDKFGARQYKTKWSDKDSFQYTVSSVFINANIEGTFLKRISLANSGNFAYWLGGTINEQAYYADQVANFNWLINSATIAPTARVDYNYNPNQSISLKVDFAALSLVTRTIYGLFAKSNVDKNVPAYFKQGTHLQTVDKFQHINIEVEYKYYASKRVIIGGSYIARWFHSSYPMDVNGIDSRFNVNFDYSVHK